MSETKRRLRLSRAVALALAAVLAALPVGARQEAEERPETEPPAEREHGHDHEHEESEHRLAVFESVEVAERGDDLVGIASSANEGTTGLEQLSLRPTLRAGDLIETVPGAVATQHSGGGKANQYFLRGFNLDHGTDFAVSVGGMPVNMPSHGHGQGYADLNFLIPELVQRARYRKGPYFAEVGDFSSAGGVDFDLVRSLPRGLTELTVGGFDYRRALWADSFVAAGGDLTGAVEYFHNDGPWRRGDGYERFNGYLGYRRGDALSGWSLTAMASDGEWLSTDQVPRRAVESGLIDRYGLLDRGPRGATSRLSLSGELHRGGDTSLTSVTAYAIRYELDLVSNFTYFLDDPVAGDQFEQVDRRWIYGAALTRRWTGHLGSRHADNAVGLTLRFDDIGNGLYRTVELARTATTRQDDVRQLGAGLWGQSWLRLTPELKLGLGLRADHYRADVTAFRPVNSGSADEWILSPKASLVWRAAQPLEVYLNAGTGFHSNDARGATIRVDPVSGEAVDRVDPLVRASGADVGLRLSAGSTYQGTVSLFWLELDSELLFVGDAGATEASRPSRRRGVEWTNYWQPHPAVGVDLDVAWTDAEFTDGDAAGPEIPGAIETTLAAGVTVSRLGPWTGALRLRYFSGGPLVEDGSVSWGSTLVVNGRLGYRWNDRLEVALEAFNLLGRNDDDIAYFYASRLPGEPAGGVEDVHFHPMERPSVRLSLAWKS